MKTLFLFALKGMPEIILKKGKKWKRQTKLFLGAAGGKIDFSLNWANITETRQQVLK